MASGWRLSQLLQTQAPIVFFFKGSAVWSPDWWMVAKARPRPFFSPDGEWVAFRRGFALHRVRVSGGQVQEFAEIDELVRAPRWASNGYVYLGSFVGGINRVSVEGGTSERLTAVDGAAGELSHRSPLPLVDQGILVYAALSGDPANTQLVVSDLDGSRAMPIATGWLPRLVSENTLVFSGTEGRLYAVKVDWDARTPLGDPVFLGMEVNTGPGGYPRYDLAANGTLMYVAGGAVSSPRRTVTWVDRKRTRDRDTSSTRSVCEHSPLTRFQSCGDPDRGE